MKKNKRLFITLIIFISVFLLFISGLVLIENKIETQLQKQQLDSFKFTSEDAEVSLLMRKVTLHNSKIEDQERGFLISIPKVTANGIRIFSLLLNDELIVGRLSLQSPEIIISKGRPDNEKEPDDESENVGRAETEQVQIKKLEVNKASLLVNHLEDYEKDSLFFIKGGLDVWSLKINSTSEQITFSEHSAERLRLELFDGNYKLPGNLYLLNFGSLVFDTSLEYLNLENLHLASVHSKYETGKFKGVETDWYDIKLRQLEILGINTRMLTNDTTVIFRKAVLEEIDAHIFRDKRLPFPEKPDTRLPMDMLQNLPVVFHSDSILITESRVVYEEHGEESQETGVVSFNQLYASIYNLSTLGDSIKGPTSMAARAMVMNKSLLEAEFVFPNNIDSYSYAVSGNLAPVDLAAFNPITEPSAFVRIDDGRLKRLDFKFSYNEHTSEGTLAMEYENLSISLLDKNDGSAKKIKTFLTETFLLKQNNLQEDNSYKKGEISFERDKEKSIFNYWWKSLFSGIRDILAF